MLIETVPAAPVDFDAPSETVIAVMRPALSAFRDISPPTFKVDVSILASMVDFILLYAIDAPSPNLPPIEKAPPTAVRVMELVAVCVKAPLNATMAVSRFARVVRVISLRDTEPEIAMPSLPVAPEPPALTATTQPDVSAFCVSDPAVMVEFLTKVSVVNVTVFILNEPAIPADFLPGSAIAIATAPEIDKKLVLFSASSFTSLPLAVIGPASRT